MAKKRKKWATDVKASVDKGKKMSIYPLSFCGECLRRFSGEMKNEDGVVIQKYNCWDTCVYLKGGTQ
jgi:hypothetical protein